MLTDNELNEIESKLANITTGPWKHSVRDLCLNNDGKQKRITEGLRENYIVTNYDDYILKSPLSVVAISYSKYHQGSPHIFIRDDDAKFIADAPTDIKNLLITIKTLKEQNLASDTNYN